MTVRLIEDWHQSWRWLSIQFIALSAALQLALVALPEELHSQLPDWLMHDLAIILLAGAALGRLVDQGKKV